jgi:nucleoid-associated protein YgaU
MTMTTSPLDLLPAPSPYPRTSRYFGVETAVWTPPDHAGGTAAPGSGPASTRAGDEIVYLRRRFVPQPGSFAAITEHVARDGDRLDLLAQRYLGDAEAWWRIADANPVLDPADLTATPGQRIRITLPAGVPPSTPD